jgi:hypothetical protein
MKEEIGALARMRISKEGSPAIEPTYKGLLEGSFLFEGDVLG